MNPSMPFPNSLLLVCGALLGLGYALAFPITTTPSSHVINNSTQSLELSPTDAALHDPRSVWSILWSCVVTIIACCWIAVHPNMLQANAGFWRSTIHRLNHMLWMIIAPELMICWAIRQWLGARNLMKKPPYNNSQSEWTVTHGYFLQMGGFMLEGKEPDILSADRLETLVDSNKIALPNITAKEIEDRSKRDGFSKIIAIGQTTWFLAQCLTRKAQGLITTELELVTIAFAALNIFIYYFWWDKPMDVQTTVKVPYLPTVSESTATDAAVEGHADDEKGGISEVPIQRVSSTGSLDKGGASKESLNSLKPEPTKTDDDQTCGCLCCIINMGWFMLGLTFVLPFLGIKAGEALFDRVSSMLFDSPPIEPGMKKIFTFYALDTAKKEKYVILACVGVIGTLFGGIHCIGWNYIFRTHTEATIWHASSITITSVPALLALSSVFLYAKESLEENHRIVSNICEVLGSVLLFLAAVGVIPYFAARVLLLVEAFISLRDLPPDALLAVRWTSFLPHF